MINITSVKRVGGTDAYPEFHVTGMWCNRPFVRMLAVEVDGRDLETSHVSGENFEINIDDWQGPGDYLDDVELPMVNAVYASPEWALLTA